MSFNNPISPIQSLGTTSIPTGKTYGTTFSNSIVGGYMQVNYLSDLIYTIPSGQTGVNEYIGNTIPINFIKGSGSAFSRDVLILNSDNLSSGRRKIGMLVYVREQDQVYQYTNDNFITLWNAATAATGTVVISDFGTTVNNSTVAGQNFINSWTASTIDGYNGVVRSNAVWKKYYGTNLALTGGSYNSGTGTLTLTNITGGTQSLTGFGSGGGTLPYLPLSGGTVSGVTNFTSGLTVNYIDFDTTPNVPAPTGGTLYFDATENALSYKPITPSNDVTVNLGQESLVRIYNNLGYQINNGQALHITGATSGSPTVSLAIGTGGDAVQFQISGIATHDIPNLSYGFMTVFGIVRDVNLTGFTVGEQVYLSQTVAGGFSSYSGLSFTGRTCEVGHVVDNSALGKLQVTILNEIEGTIITTQENNILAANNSSTGVFQFSGLSITTPSGTTFNVGAVEGWIIDNVTSPTNPTIQLIIYSGATGIPATNVTSATETYILLTSGLTITQQTTFPTPQQRRQNLYLGKFGHGNKQFLINAFNEPDSALSPVSQLRDMFTVIKLVNDGVIASANGANLNINTSAGVLYGLGIGYVTNKLNPNSLTINGQSPATFQYRTQTGGTASNTTLIDPLNRDVNGVITPITGTKATNQRIYLLQNGQIRVQYGQQEYNQLAAAVAALQNEVFVTFPNFRDNGILIGVLSILSTCTQLNDTSKAQFFSVSKFGELIGAAGGTSTTTLQQAYNNSSEPEILINSTLDGLSIRNGTGNADNVTQLLQGQNTAGSVTSFIRADGAISGTSISATTISATTYQNLPLSVSGGGTTSYIPKWTGSTGIGNSIIYDTGTNIGIGLTNPGYKLEVRGGITASGPGNLGTFLAIDTSVGGATVALNAQLSTGIAQLVTYSNSPIVIATNSAERMRVTNDGNVGIGTSSPSAKLHVTGNTLIQGSLTATTISATTYQNLPFSGTVGGTGTSNFVTKWGNGIDIADSLIYDDSSFVGINTTAPIYSELISFQTSNRGITIDGLYIQENTNGSLAFATGFDYNSWGTAGGEIAIGTRGPLENSTGSGNIGIGDKALQSNTSGSNNIAIGGTSALGFNLTGSDNIAIGNSSLQFNDDGLQNVAIGNGTLFNNITGDRNTVLGNDAGYSNLSDYNVYIGHAAGYSNDGSNNIFIGYSAGYADTSSSNKLNIGDTIIGDLSAKSISVPTISATTYQNLPSSVGGVGTTDYIPLWTGSTEIGNSIMYQSATNPGFTNIVTIDGVAAGNGVFLDVNTANQNFSGTRFKITGNTYFVIGTSNSPSINSFVIQSFTNTGSVVGYPFKIPNGTTRVIINEATDDNVSALNVNGRVRATTISATTYNNLPFSGTVTGSGTTRYIPSWSNSSNLNATIIYNATDKIGINTSSPSATLHVSGDTIISSGLTATTISGNSLTLSNSASTISLNNTTRQQIRFFSGGTGAPTYNTYSAGAKIIFSDNISSISSGYAIGVDAGSLWYGADLTGNGHDWYAGTRKLASLVGSSGFQLIGLGGPGTSASMTISGTSALGSKGGTGYTDFLQVINNWSGATNPNKWFRVNSIGGFEILNSAYSAQIFSLTDTGILSVAGGNLATTSSSDGVTNYLMLGNNNTQIYDDGNTHIHSRAANQSMWINTNGGQLNLLTQSPLLGGSIGSGIAIATSTLNGYVTINTGRTVTTAASYGYLINSSSPTGQYNAGSQSLVISLYANNRIWGQEIDAFSDERMKDIHGEITLEEGIKLVKNLKPIKYNWKEGDDRGTKAGYSAQQVIKSGFDHLIGLIPTEGLEETIDEDGFLSPKDTQFAMNYDQVTPYHGVVIKHLLEKIEQLENRIKDLENR